MAQLIPGDDVERCLRACLEAEGYRLSSPRRNGETGVDLTAERGSDKHFIEVIGFREFPPKLSRSQLEVRWPLQAESYALLIFLATLCS